MMKTYTHYSSGDTLRVTYVEPLALASYTAGVQRFIPATEEGMKGRWVYEKSSSAPARTAQDAALRALLAEQNAEMLLDVIRQAEAILRERGGHEPHRIIREAIEVLRPALLQIKELTSETRTKARKRGESDV